MKNIVIILFFVFSTFSMGLKIDDVDFDQEMVLGEKATKEFFLENKKNEIPRYKLGIEEREKSVSVKPQVLILRPGDRKSFKVTAQGKRQGEYRYFLILQEEMIDLEKNKKDVKIKTKYRIRQKYNVLER